MSAQVHDFMTRRIVIISPVAKIDLAEHIALANRCRHLLVLEKGDLVGVTCICDLRRGGPGDSVVERMRPPVIIAAGATTDEAAMLMRASRVGCLPVVRSGLLVGVLSRGDLVRAGMDPELMGRATCAACGFAHNLAEDPRTPGISFCLYCRERSVPPDEDDDIGGTG